MRIDGDLATTVWPDRADPDLLVLHRDLELTCRLLATQQESPLLRLNMVFVSDAWVYLLRCRDGSLYTGWTTDLERRVARHRAGKASRYTASRLPVELALELPMPDRTAARREEARIKRLKRTDKLALIQKSDVCSKQSTHM